MKYIAITETVEIPLFQEPKEYSREEMDNIIKDFYKVGFSPIDSNPKIKPMMLIPMSEETFKFIESVSTVYVPIFGEKEYEINKLKFKIYTEEEYEKRYGKINL